MRDVLETIGFVVTVIIGDMSICGIAFIVFGEQDDDNILPTICAVNIVLVITLAFALYATQGGMK